MLSLQFDFSLKCLRPNNKSEVAPVHAMKAYSGSGGTAPLIINLDTGWTRVANFTPSPVYLQWRIHRRSGRFWEEKNHFFLPEFELRTSQTVAHRVWFDFQHIEDNFSLLRNVEICFQPSVQWIPGVKESQLEAEHSNPSIDKIRNEWRCTSILTHMPSFYAQDKLDVFANANLVSCHKIT